jgi:hypothetical protein
VEPAVTGVCTAAAVAHTWPHAASPRARPQQCSCPNGGSCLRPPLAGLEPGRAARARARQIEKIRCRFTPQFTLKRWGPACRAERMYVNQKAILGRKSITYVGYSVSYGKVSADSHKVEAIQDMPDTLDADALAPPLDLVRLRLRPVAAAVGAVGALRGQGADEPREPLLHKLDESCLGWRHCHRAQRLDIERATAAAAACSIRVSSHPANQQPVSHRKQVGPACHHAHAMPASISVEPNEPAGQLARSS